MPTSDFPNTLLYEEHGHLVVTVRSPLSDDQWRSLCRRVTVASARAHQTTGIVLHLTGLDVLDSFSLSALQGLCNTLHSHGQKAVISGIPLPVSVALSIRGLHIREAPVVPGLPEAFTLLERPPPYPHAHVPPGPHH